MKGVPLMENMCGGPRGEASGGKILQVAYMAKRKKGTGK